MLVALLFYAYATGVRASRKIANATYDSVAFRYIGANKHPDHDTIAAFRRRFLPYLESIFNEILQLAKELKCLEVGRVSLDGTKIKASASKHRALSLKGADRIEAQLRREVKRMFELAEEADQADEVAGDQLEEQGGESQEIASTGDGSANTLGENIRSTICKAKIDSPTCFSRIRV